MPSDRPAEYGLPAAAAAAIAVALLAAGCGGSGPASTGTARTTKPAGELLFVRNCGACHRLAAAGTSGTIGGDLDELRPSRRAVLRAIADGPGTMPAALLAGADAQTVAGYIAHVAGG